mmetsp:Transcript_3236/g.3571  ORF Transcript_3236/g.3571 Transcript_3236/m.3571 type:complete len:102 (+) Transcript_3236:62-367(+)
MTTKIDPHKAVVAKILEQYDKGNTGEIGQDGLSAMLVDAYRIVGEFYKPKPGDVEHYQKVLDKNGDGKVTEEDLQILAKKYLGTGLTSFGGSTSGYSRSAV